MIAVLYLPDDDDPLSGPIQQTMQSSPAAIEATARVAGWLAIEVEALPAADGPDYDETHHIQRGELVPLIGAG